MAPANKRDQQRARRPPCPWGKGLKTRFFKIRLRTIPFQGIARGSRRFERTPRHSHSFLDSAFSQCCSAASTRPVKRGKWPQGGAIRGLIHPDPDTRNGQISPPSPPKKNCPNGMLIARSKTNSPKPFAFCAPHEPAHSLRDARSALKAAERGAGSY